jgi:hypothetical protein
LFIKKKGHRIILIKCEDESELMKKRKIIKGTTQSRIDEAKQSITAMQASFQDNYGFFDAFELFLTRARGIIDYFENQIGLRHVERRKNRNEREEKYVRKKTVLFQDPLVKFINSLRNDETHEIQAEIINEYRSPNGTHELSCGIVQEGSNNDHDPQIEGEIVRRVFSNKKNLEVVQGCREYLKKVKFFVSDVERELKIF